MRILRRHLLLGSAAATGMVTDETSLVAVLAASHQWFYLKRPPQAGAFHPIPIKTWAKLSPISPDGIHFVGYDNISGQPSRTFSDQYGIVNLLTGTTRPIVLRKLASSAPIDGASTSLTLSCSINGDVFAAVLYLNGKLTRLIAYRLPDGSYTPNFVAEAPEAAFCFHVDATGKQVLASHFRDVTPERAISQVFLVNGMKLVTEWAGPTDVRMSPNGRWLAGWKGERLIARLVSGGNPKTLTSVFRATSPPIWSPNSKMLLTTARTTADEIDDRIIVIDVETGKEIPIALHPGNGYSGFAWTTHAVAARWP